MPFIMCFCLAGLDKCSIYHSHFHRTKYMPHIREDSDSHLSPLTCCANTSFHSFRQSHYAVTTVVPQVRLPPLPSIHLLVQYILISLSCRQSCYTSINGVQNVTLFWKCGPYVPPKHQFISPKYTKSQCRRL